jgi:hypothetical protein
LLSPGRWFTVLTAGITAIVLAVNGYLLYDVMRQQVKVPATNYNNADWISHLEFI